MSTSYTFTPGLRVTVGEATKKSEYDAIARNIDELDERLEARPTIDDFLAVAGSASYFYDAATGDLTQVRLHTSPVGTIDFTYDATTGDLREARLRMSDPQDIAITETYTYNATTGDLIGLSRTVT